MKEILLTQGKVAIVDDEDFEWLNQWKWCAKKGPNTSYAKRATQLYMHRLILSAEKGMFVDHINGNGLDNRRENLRVCTHAENMRNSKLSIKNTSGYKGVYWCKKRSLWIANIQNNGKVKNLGGFKIKELAARAYNEAAHNFHGEFARLNNVDIP